MQLPQDRYHFSLIIICARYCFFTQCFSHTVALADRQLIPNRELTRRTDFTFLILGLRLTLPVPERIFQKHP